MLFGIYNIKLNSGGWIRFPRNLRYYTLTKWITNHFVLGRIKDADEGLFWLFLEPIELLPELVEILADSDNCDIQPNKAEAMEMIRNGINKANPPSFKLRIPIELRKEYRLKPGEELIVIGVGNHIEVWRLSDFERYFF